MAEETPARGRESTATERTAHGFSDAGSIEGSSDGSSDGGVRPGIPRSTVLRNGDAAEANRQRWLGDAVPWLGSGVDGSSCTGMGRENSGDCGAGS